MITRILLQQKNMSKHISGTQMFKKSLIIEPLTNIYKNLTVNYITIIT